MIETLSLIALSSLATIGDSSPVTDFKYASLNPPQIAPDGRIAFAAELEHNTNGTRKSVLIAGAPGALSMVLEEGQPLPGASGDAVFRFIDRNSPDIFRFWSPTGLCLNGTLQKSDGSEIRAGLWNIDGAAQPSAIWQAGTAAFSPATGAHYESILSMAGDPATSTLVIAASLTGPLVNDENRQIGCAWSGGEWKFLYRKGIPVSDPLDQVNIPNDLTPPVQTLGTGALIRTEKGLLAGHAPAPLAAIAFKGNRSVLFPGETLSEMEAYASSSDGRAVWLQTTLNPADSTVLPWKLLTSASGLTSLFVQKYQAFPSHPSSKGTWVQHITGCSFAGSVLTLQAHDDGSNLHLLAGAGPWDTMQTLVSTRDAMPSAPSGETFSTLAALGITSAGNLVIHGSNGTTHSGYYVFPLDGTNASKIVQTGDDYAGKLIETVLTASSNATFTAGSPAAVSGNGKMVFLATFKEGGAAILSADVP